MFLVPLVRYKSDSFEIIHLSNAPGDKLLIQTKSDKDSQLLIVDETSAQNKIVNRIFIIDYIVRSSILLPK